MAVKVDKGGTGVTSTRSEPHIWNGMERSRYIIKIEEKDSKNLVASGLQEANVHAERRHEFAQMIMVTMAKRK